MAEQAPASTGGSSMGGGEEASEVKAEILSLDESIVEKSKWLRQNEKEIQQLVQWVEQAASIVRACKLSGDSEAIMPMLNDLKVHLKDARNIVLHNRQHESYSSKVGEEFVCGVDGAKSWQKPEEILQVASKIEWYVQVLPAVANAMTVPDASADTRGHPGRSSVVARATRTTTESSEEASIAEAEILSLTESMVVEDSSTTKAEILSLVESIEKEATRIKQLVQAVQQAGIMMQNLQASDLSRAPEAMPMLSDLKQHLKAAQDIVHGGADSWHQQIIQVTSKIEDYVQVLPAVVGMRHTSLRDSDTRTS